MKKSKPILNGKVDFVYMMAVDKEQTQVDKEELNLISIVKKDVGESDTFDLEEGNNKDGEQILQKKHLASNSYDLEANFESKDLNFVKKNTLDDDIR